MRRRHRIWNWWRQAVFIAAVLGSPAIASYAAALAQPGTDTLSEPAAAKLTHSPLADAQGGSSNTAPAARETPVPPEIDPALRNDRDTLATTNLLPSRLKDDERLQLETLQSRLAQGRAQRRERDFKQADKTLSSLMAENAPSEIHRSAMLELALTAQDEKLLPRAQQIFGQYVQRFHDDPSVPEVLLRQGLLYREMGAPVLALSKFYSVMSSALALKLDRLAYYQRLVLQAQTEIAETYYQDGKFEEAADFFGRLLKLDCPDLNREQVMYKQVRSLAAGKRNTETVAQAQAFATAFPASAQLPEARFLMARSLRELGRNNEAREQFLTLLRDRQGGAGEDPELRAYWQQRTGNEVANQLYRDGDYIKALEIYLRLADLNSAAPWRLPALYQAGLIYEHLKQPEKAGGVYNRLIDEAKDAGADPAGEDLKTVLEMARWRKERLNWQTRAASANEELSRAAAAAGITNTNTPTL